MALNRRGFIRQLLAALPAMLIFRPSNEAVKINPPRSRVRLVTPGLDPYSESLRSGRVSTFDTETGRRLESSG